MTQDNKFKQPKPYWADEIDFPNGINKSKILERYENDNLGYETFADYILNRDVRRLCEMKNHYAECLNKARSEILEMHCRNTDKSAGHGYEIRLLLDTIKDILDDKIDPLMLNRIIEDFDIRYNYDTAYARNQRMKRHWQRRTPHGW
jgi:hypothetical protein|tara:strand:+ start:28 stop:468 length:441 start_codon:yes stop_codon:yes gene_type:complete